MASKHSGLVKKIIGKYGYVTKKADRYRAGIDSTLAFATFTEHEKKKEAEANLQTMLENEFDNGNIVLSDDWEKDNLS